MIGQSGSVAVEFVLNNVMENETTFGVLEQQQQQQLQQLQQAQYEQQKQEHTNHLQIYFNSTNRMDVDNVSSTLSSFYDYGDFNFTLNVDCMNQYNSHAEYLNVSCTSSLDLTLPLYGYCLPFLLFITLTVNSLIVLVLSRRNMISSTNMVLMAMALCDMFTLLFPAPGFIYMYTFGNHNRPLSPIVACYMWIVMSEVVPSIFHTASVWLTLALAVQRYIFVCHAPAARIWCTTPRARKYICYICMVAVFSQTSRFFDRSYRLAPIEWNQQQANVCLIDTAEWVTESIGVDFYYTSFYLFRIVFVHLLPCAFLVALNVLLFRAMSAAQKNRDKLFKETKTTTITNTTTSSTTITACASTGSAVVKRKSETKKQRDANSTTLMLIVVVSVFLIAEIPLAIITALHVVSSLIIEVLDYHLANKFILFANFFLIVSYPINFAIYCGMSRQFRVTFKELFIGNGGVGGGRSGLAGCTGTRSTSATTKKENNSSRYSLVHGQRTCCTNETVL